MAAAPCSTATCSSPTSVYPGGVIPHFDAVTSGSANGVVLRHNTLTAPPDQTAAVNFTNDFGSIRDVTIDNNLLTGGGYALYLRGDPGPPTAAGR